MSDFRNIDDWKVQGFDKLKTYLQYSSQLMPDVNLTNQYLSKNVDQLENEPHYELISTRNKVYAPGTNFFFKNRKSRLTKLEQTVCLNILKHFRSGGTEETLTDNGKREYQIYKLKLNNMHQENLEFLDSAKQKWNSSVKYFKKNINSVVLKHAEKAWKTRMDLRLFYPCCFAPSEKVISLSYEETDPKVLVNLLQNVGHFGQIAEFSPPQIFLPRLLHVWGLPNPGKRPHTLDSKLPVSLDEHIKAFVNDYDFDVAVTVSTLTKLMDDSTLNSDWDIPVVVKHHGTKKVVYIDKALPKKQPNHLDFMNKSFKDLIRTTYCRFPLVCFPIEESPRLFPKCVPKKINVEEKETLDVPISLQKQEDQNESSDAKRPKLENPSTVKIIQDNTLEESLINSNLIHNVTYKIWSIGLTQETNHLLKQQASKTQIKFLVRCKIDACESFNKNDTNCRHTVDIGPGEPGSPLKPLIILPKIEQQVDLGGNISTKSEIIKQWSSLFFRPQSEIRKFRIIGEEKEVLAVDNISLPMVNHEAITYHKSKPVLRLGVLHKVFSKLINLEEGNYILQHKAKQGYFVSVLKEEKGADESVKSCYNLRTEYTKKNCKLNTISKLPWCPIDVHYITPQHLAFKRMPGLFAPLIVPQKAINKIKNSKMKQCRLKKMSKNKV